MNVNAIATPLPLRMRAAQHVCECHGSAVAVIGLPTLRPSAFLDSAIYFGSGIFSLPQGWSVTVGPTRRIVKLGEEQLASGAVRKRALLLPDSIFFSNGKISVEIDMVMVFDFSKLSAEQRNFRVFHGPLEPVPTHVHWLRLGPDSAEMDCSLGFDTDDEEPDYPDAIAIPDLS